MDEAALAEPRYAEAADTDPLLYHYPHSFGSEIVRLALAEKGVTWRGRIVDIGPEHANYRPWFMRLSPTGTVPTLKHDEQVISDTRAILDHLEAAFPDPSLMPDGASGRQEADQWMAKGLAFPDRELAFVSARAFSPLLWRWDMPRRKRLLEGHRSRAPDLQERYDAKLADLAAWRAAVAGPDAQESHARTAAGMLDELEDRLSDGRDWIAGQHSLADVVWTVLLARLTFFHLGDHITGGARPRVAAYFARAKARPSFTAAPVYTEWDPMVTLPSLFRVLSPWLMGLAVLAAFLLWTLL